VQYIERNLLLLVTLASDLPLHTIKFCSVPLIVVIHASYNKQDPLMCGGLCSEWTSMLTAINNCMVDHQLLIALHQPLI